MLAIVLLIALSDAEGRVARRPLLQRERPARVKLFKCERPRLFKRCR